MKRSPGPNPAAAPSAASSSPNARKSPAKALATLPGQIFTIKKEVQMPYNGSALRASIRYPNHPGSRTGSPETSEEARERDSATGAKSSREGTEASCGSISGGAQFRRDRRSYWHFTLHCEIQAQRALCRPKGRSSFRLHPPLSLDGTEAAQRAPSQARKRARSNS